VSGGKGGFAIPVSRFIPQDCPSCGAALESRGPFDGTEPSTGVTGGHEGFGDTFLCGQGHWWTLLGGALIPPEHILTVVEEASSS
jgi:hypothetical protein